MTSRLAPGQAVPAAAVRVDAVSVSIDRQPLLAPTSLTLERGHAIAIRGRNGSGKTTLLRVLTGAQRPSSGSALVYGAPVDVRNLQFRRRLAALLGPPPLARELTVREHLRFIAATWGIEAVDAAADALLDDLGIAHLGRRFGHELSSGQSQLFALAMTLIRPFDVLVLDEPEQRLDEERRALVARVLRQRIDAGAALVFASHSRDLIEQLADHDITVHEPVGSPGP